MIASAAALALGGAHARVDQQRLLERLADRLARVERAVGVLEDDLDFAPQALARRMRSPAPTSSPSISSAPAVGVSIMVSRRASVDLPEPDSPTTASVRPASSANETPASAFTVAGGRKAPREADVVAREAPGFERRRSRARPLQRGGLRDAVLERRVAERSAEARRRAAGRDAAAGVEREMRSAARTGSLRAGRTGPAPRRESRAGGAPSPAPAARRAARRCRDGADRRRDRACALASTCWPAYWTMTRSAVSATTPMSWVMRTSPMPVSRRSASSRSRICAWMVTSSAVVGSSAIRSFGRQASAMAIITRWLMPPESWWGKRADAALGIGDADLGQQLDDAPARAPCDRGRDGSSAPRRSGSRR